MKPRAWKEKCDAHTQYLIKHALPSGKKERKKAIRVQREENKKNEWPPVQSWMSRKFAW